MQRSISFFDDDKDLTSTFWKKDSSPTSSRDWTPTTGQFFFKKSKKRKGEIKRVYICLFKNYLVISKSKEWYKKYKSLDLSKYFLIFKRLSDMSDGFADGFSLGYNSKKIELYSKTSEDANNFVYHLKRYVVQNNFNDMYITHEKLGTGSYAEVYRIEDKLTHTVYAAKMFRPTALKGSQNAKTVVMNEITIQRKLEHPHIIKLHEVYEFEGKVVLVLEYAPGRRLLDYVMEHAPFSEKKCILLMKQLLEATIYIHSLGIIHRDIKLENTIIIGENDTGDALSLKILDFGLSVYADNVNFLKKSGTPGYVAPEIFQGESYGQKIDVFSLGVILYTMLSGKSPFVGPDRRTVLTLNKKCEYTLKGKHWTKQSANAKDLVKKMMEADPTKRLDARTALEHPWFTIVFLNGVQPVVNIPKVMLMSNKHIFANRSPSPTPSVMNSSIAHHIEPMKKTDSERNIAELRIRSNDKEKSTLDTNRSHSTRYTGKAGQHFNHHFLQIPAQMMAGNPNSQVMLTSVAFDEKMDLSSYDDAINRSSIKTFYKAHSSAHSPKVSSEAVSASSGGVELSPPKRQKLSTENSGIIDEIARENPDVKDKLSSYAAFEANRKPSVLMDSRSRGLVSLENIPEAREDKQTCEVTVTNDEDSSRGLVLAVAQTPRHEDRFKVFAAYLKSPTKPRKRGLAAMKRIGS